MIHWIGLRENLIEKAKVFTIKYRAVLLEFPRKPIQWMIDVSTRYGCRAFPPSRASVVKVDSSACGEINMAKYDIELTTIEMASLTFSKSWSLKNMLKWTLTWTCNIYIYIIYDILIQWPCISLQRIAGRSCNDQRLIPWALCSGARSSELHLHGSGVTRTPRMPRQREGYFGMGKKRWKKWWLKLNEDIGNMIGILSYWVIPIHKLPINMMKHMNIWLIGKFTIQKNPHVLWGRYELSLSIVNIPHPKRCWSYGWMKIWMNYPLVKLTSLYEKSSCFIGN